MVQLPIMFQLSDKKDHFLPFGGNLPIMEKCNAGKPADVVHS